MAVSPLVGGKVLKGPTAAFMEWTGQPLSSDGIAAAYDGLIDGLVADERTEAIPTLEIDVLLGTPQERRSGRRSRRCGSPTHSDSVRRRCGRVAILPIKSFGEAKQRLAHEFDAPTRRALAQAMFSDVLVALRRAPSVDETVVVTADNGAQRIAGGYGATVLDDDDRGHNVAALNGIRHALMSGADRTLLVPGDCPMLDPKELEELLARPVPERSALIVPDRHGTGTNALLLTPPEAMTPAFGPGSCQRHVEHARPRTPSPRS